jgi:Na+/pantothenate symporter
MRQRSVRNPRSNTRLQESFLAMSAALIAAFYVIMGILLITLPQMFRGLTYDTRLILAIALFVYGAFRGYRAYLRWQER